MMLAGRIARNIERRDDNPADAFSIITARLRRIPECRHAYVK